MKALWTNIYVRRWVAIFLTVVVIWLFREHLKDLSSLLWPIVVAGTIFGFRNELSALLKRLRRVGKGGAEFGEERIAAQIMARPVDVALKDVVPDEEHSGYVRLRIEALRVELNARVPEDEQRREYLLMLRLAEAQQNRDFAFAWLHMFNSQLEALTRMATENSVIDLSPYHELHVSRSTEASTPDNPVNALPFEVWANFFVQRQLAVVTNRTATIMDQGRDLLALAVQTKLPRFQVL